MQFKKLLNFVQRHLWNIENNLDKAEETSFELVQQVHLNPLRKWLHLQQFTHKIDEFDLFIFSVL